MGNNTSAIRDFGQWDLEGIYKDEGCTLHDRCLTCPLPQCVYGNALKYNRAIAFPLISSTMSREELAPKIGVSIRTAQRLIVRYNKVGGDFNKFLGTESDVK